MSSARRACRLSKSIVVDRREAGARHLMEPPYVVKPVNEGSSVGVFIIRKGDNRPPAELGSDTWTLCDEMMVEEYVPGRELTVAVMGGKALGVTEIVTEDRILRLRSEICRRRLAIISCRPIIPAAVADEAMGLAERRMRCWAAGASAAHDFRYDDIGDESQLDPAWKSIRSRA